MAGKKAKWSLSVIQRIGREALALADEFKTELQPRLASGVIDGLRADLPALDDKRSAADSTLGTLKGATLKQNEAVAQAIAFLSVGRKAVVRAGASATQRQAFGTTRAYRADSVASVVAALDTFISGAGQHVDFVRAAGLLPADLDTAAALRASLMAADQSQEAQKSARKVPTRERNATHLRIEAAIDALINAGQLAFLTKPDIAARFTGLVPGTTAKKPTPKA